MAALENTGYFDICARRAPSARRTQALARGEVLFVLNIPPNFSRDSMRGERPQVLMDADATDPAAIGNATAALAALDATRARPRPAAGTLADAADRRRRSSWCCTRRYNPEAHHRATTSCRA